MENRPQIIRRFLLEEGVIGQHIEFYSPYQPKNKWYKKISLKKFMYSKMQKKLAFNFQRLLFRWYHRWFEKTRTYKMKMGNYKPEYGDVFFNGKYDSMYMGNNCYLILNHITKH